MILGGRRAPYLLFIGDVAVFTASLWLTLWVRYGELPSEKLLADHSSFFVLFALWALIFYMAGLYGKRVALFPSRLPDALLRTQVLNIILAALFFFVVPDMPIAPKTILALYLVVSLVLIYYWRLVLYPKFSYPRSRLQVVLIGEGTEAEELVQEVNGNPRYPIVFTKTLPPFAPELPEVMRRETVAELADMYEEIFDRVPLSLLHEDWFVKHVSATTPMFYAVTKRCIDILGGLAMGLVAVLVLPFVALANWIEGPGPILIRQERIGKNGVRMHAYKFRSMRQNDSSSREWVGEGANRVTRVGAFLRRTSLDEFPQFINVLKGELSLIGPRNDIVGLGVRLAEALPYYNARYLVTPGITGWAQINQQYEQGHISPQSIVETQTRLAYDFYYLKKRSLGLDIMIALLTVKRMFFRVSNW